ncbi:MAG: 2-C-methyl-D-erythritol 4-phosphate cytidylyltransferase [Ruthenibacterium lactatiformans]
MVHGHTVAAVIVAAGASRRMGFDKLAYPLDGGTVLEKSVRAFDTHPAIDDLLVAGENAPQARLLARPGTKPAKTVAGGATRVQSVRASWMR